MKIADFQTGDDRYTPKKIGQLWYIVTECYVIITSIRGDDAFECVILKNDQRGFGKCGSSMVFSFNAKHFEYFLIGDVA